MNTNFLSNNDLKKENYIIQSISESTNVNFRNTENYYFKLPSNIDIFSKVPDHYDLINNSKNKESIYYFLSVFKMIILQYMQENNISNQLSKLAISKDDDGAIVIRWSYRHYRIFFSFENNISESNYGITADDNITGKFFSMTEPLIKDNYSNILSEIIQFVMGTT